MGTRGLLVTNALALGLALVLGVPRAADAGLARRGRSAAAVALVLGHGGARCTCSGRRRSCSRWASSPAGLFAWRRQRPILAAVLLGIATYTKPYNLFLALPLGVEPLAARARRRRRWWPALRESLRRGLVMAAVVVGLFGLNAAVTGELNYQGGERKTFYGRFPEEARADGQTVTFGNSGFWMTTDQLGPAGRGRGRRRPRAHGTAARAPTRSTSRSCATSATSGSAASAARCRISCPRSLALVVFLVVGPRDAAGWLAFAALVVSWLFYIRMIPDNWYGGGGTVGNRYFLNLLPLFVLMLPARPRDGRGGGGGAVRRLPGPMLAPSRCAHSLRPGRPRDAAAVPRAAARADDAQRPLGLHRRLAQEGAVRGHRGRPAQALAGGPEGVLPLLHGRRHVRQGAAGGRRRGSGCAAAAPAEVVLRALEPVRRMRVRVTGGPIGDRVTVRVCGVEQAAEVGPDETKELVFEPGAGFPYYDTFLTIVRLRSERGQSAARRPAAARRVRVDRARGGPTTAPLSRQELAADLAHSLSSANRVDRSSVPCPGLP